MRLAWAVDLHLVFLTPTAMTPDDDLTPFLEELARQPFDALAISGDISEAPKLEWHLLLLEEFLKRPIYFVLGNHDFYRSSIAEVLPRMKALSAASDRLCCLEFQEWVDLSPSTGLVGHGCWADGRYGDFHASPAVMNDWKVIEELKKWSKGPQTLTGLRGEEAVSADLMQWRLSANDVAKDALLDELHALGDRAADHIRRVLPAVFRHKDRAILLTHAPPFLPEKGPGTTRWEDWAPHAGCKAAGDAILEIMRELPDKQLLILSGHCHLPAEFSVAVNVQQKIGDAEYLEPRIDRIFALE